MKIHSSIAFYPKRYISHFLILLSVIISIFGFLMPNLVQLFGLHRIQVSSDSLFYVIGQIVLFQFLHGGFLHLFLNSYFLYQAGPEIESRMQRKTFFIFFAGSSLFVALSLWIFSGNVLTVGISGFCMALLSYLYMDLNRIRHPYANQILFMLVVNILMGLYGNISFVGHLSGALWGFLWWQMREKRKFR
ncbi:MAG: hypothetical protein HHAS10_02910 [Candidatus Altimarinota bacterium]